MNSRQRPPTIPSDIDIYRSASLMIHHYRDEATREAALRAEAMLKSGKPEGERIWRAIERAIEKLKNPRGADAA